MKAEDTMKAKFRFFKFNVLEGPDGLFQVNDRRLQKGYITLNVDENGYAIDSDYDIITKVKAMWMKDVAIEIWYGGDTGRIIEFEQSDCGCPVGHLVPEDEICQPI